MHHHSKQIYLVTVSAAFFILGIYPTRAAAQNSFPTPAGVVNIVDRDGTGCCAQLQLVVNDQQTHFYEYGNGYGNGSFQIHKYGSGSVGGPVFTILKTGNVGIGTTSPAARLYIAGGGYGSPGPANQGAYALGAQSIAADASIYSYGAICSGNNWGNCASSGGVVLGINNTAAAVNIPNSGNITFNNGGNVGIGKTNPTVALDVVGSINVTGNINAKYQDVAEWVPSSEKLTAGTVVVLDSTKSNQVVASITAYDTRVAGVISAQPGITLGEKSDSKVLVATTGRVRVKVDASHGPINIGDLLVTSDIPGVAMKSEAVNLGGVSIHRPGTIIGKALEPLEKGKGEILALLSLQ